MTLTQTEAMALTLVIEAAVAAALAPAYARTAWLCASQYEWTQHRAIGRSVGLSEDQLEAIGSDPQSALLDEQTRLLLAGVAELLDDHKLSDATYEALREALPPKLILEYTMLVGTYAALAGSLNSFGVPLEDAWQQRT